MTPKQNTASVERPPVVAVLGHVDHGKSTLLDYIRKANTVAKEAGGITQHIAAYEIEREKDGVSKRITFIDTPGHAAFKAIRERGANVADIAILVVAADDGVKAQTLEALQSIRDAKIPFIVAINKVDKPNADLNRTIQTLLEQNVFLEKYGGDVPWAAVSAKTGANVDELLDLILIVAEFQELRGDASVDAEGYVIEAHRDQRRGMAATLILKNGTLKGGMFVLAGTALAPVRLMENHAGKAVREASFSSPVQLIGFDELPDVGVPFKSFDKKRDAESAQQAAHQAAVAASRKFELATEEGRYSMPIIVRADTTGSLEAINLEVSKLGDEYSSIAIVQSGIGNVSESDVKAALSAPTPVTVIAFDVGIDPIADALAKRDAVQIDTFNIIYKLTERLQELLEERRPRRTVDTVLGRARILKQFSSSKSERTVGGSVIDGFIEKNGDVRVMRRGTLAGTGVVINIQTNKQNVSRASEGAEFGAQIEADFDIMQGDVLEHFKTSKE